MIMYLDIDKFEEEMREFTKIAGMQDNEIRFSLNDIISNMWTSGAKLRSESDMNREDYDLFQSTVNRVINAEKVQGIDEVIVSLAKEIKSYRDKIENMEAYIAELKERIVKADKEIECLCAENGEYKIRLKDYKNEIDSLERKLKEPAEEQSISEAELDSKVVPAPGIYGDIHIQGDLYASFYEVKDEGT